MALVPPISQTHSGVQLMTGGRAVLKGPDFVLLRTAPGGLFALARRGPYL